MILPTHDFLEISPGRPLYEYLPAADVAPQTQQLGEQQAQTQQQQDQGDGNSTQPDATINKTVCDLTEGDETLGQNGNYPATDFLPGSRSSSAT